jgi:hypothetical protein
VINSISAGPEPENRDRADEVPRAGHKGEEARMIHMQHRVEDALSQQGDELYRVGGLLRRRLPKRPLEGGPFAPPAGAGRVQRLEMLDQRVHRRIAQGTHFFTI